MLRLEDHEVLERCLDACQDACFSQFWRSEHRVLQEGILMYLMVHLKDALHILNQQGMRISFFDDINRSESISDITDLVYQLRNALCHINSAHKSTGMHGFVDVTFISPGWAGAPLISIESDNINIGNEKSDDWAICCGRLRVYLFSHIYRCIREAIEAGETVSAKNGHWWKLKYDLGKSAPNLGMG